MSEPFGKLRSTAERLTVFFLYSELGSDGSEYEQLSTPDDSEEADDDHDFDVDGAYVDVCST